MNAATQLASEVGTAPACAAVGVARATHYRHRQVVESPRPVNPRPTPPRALSADERRAVLDTLHSKRFADQAPAEVYATLLDEDRYLCSIRTMYRLLHGAQEVRERRDQLRHPQYHKPELLATGPNQVWSWDITKLLGPAKWSYFYLYVIMDIFSRYVVGWTLAERESGQLAQRLIRETCVKENIEEGQLTIHADRGTSMTSQTVAQLLATLGVVKSHSRPQVSNDNPFSESQFKTLKYQPEFPQRFASHEHGLTFCREFFPWYNDEHHHWGLGLMTPATVHTGRAAEVLAARQDTLSTAYTAHPQRFVHREPRPQKPPAAVWINPPAAPQKTETPLLTLH
jgi:transposase InsO family protein